MKPRSILVLVSALVVLLICFILFQYPKGLNSSKSEAGNNLGPYYRLVSLKDYNQSLCDSTGFQYMPNGFNSGAKVVLVDAVTGENLSGDGFLTTVNGAGTFGVEYTCFEQINSTKSVVTVNAGGYSSISFYFNLPENKLALIEIPMARSCTTGRSCLENLEVLSGMNEDTNTEDLIRDSTERIQGLINDNFGFAEGDYSLSCLECSLTRGGFIKARGVYRGETPFELYYHWGWCSSGGSDCGWSACFSIDKKQSELKNKVTDLLCNRILSAYLNDGMLCTINSSSDNTADMRYLCTSGGAFQQTSDETWTISLNQYSGRCESSPSDGIFPCI